MILDSLSLVGMDLEEFSAYEPLPDFDGATADVVELGVSEEAAAGVLVYVSVTAVYLDALLRASHGIARGSHVDRGTFDVAFATSVKHFGCLVGISSGGLEQVVHVCYFGLHDTHFSKLFAELFSLDKVIHG